VSDKIDWREVRKRLVGEIRERIAEAKWYARGTQADELSAALKIAQIHQKWAGKSRECQIDEEIWPCDTAKALLDCYVPGWRE
jgi:hypothetical protein